MYVDISDAFAVKTVAFNESERLVVVRHNHDGKFLQQLQNERAVGQGSTRDFADHERMHDHDIAFEQFGELRFAPAQVVDPDRCVDEYQAAEPWRRRRGAFNSR